MRVLIVADSGGVLLDMLALRPWWSRHETSWVAAPAADTLVALDGLDVSWRPGWPAAWRLLRRRRPDVIVSAGHRTAVPYFVLGRLHRTPTVWVETITQVGRPVGSARLCTWLAGAVVTQRPGRSGRLRRPVVELGELL